MRKGFVFGKFMPFHFGHKALIEFAKTQCDFLYIVVCASEKEALNVITRSHWITETFPLDQNIQIISFEYLEKNLPNTSVADREVSKLWAAQFSEMLPDAEVLITSEPYGEFVADAMEIQHILFDQDRDNISISATEIRKDIAKNWNYLPDVVKPYYQKKIVLLGTESTGKSSLSEALAEEFGGSLVTEAGREIVENSNEIDERQLQMITFEQGRKIEAAEIELNPFIFIDTDIHITQSYAKFSLGHYLVEVPDEIYDVNKADIYFYLTNDFPYTQDGTRLELKDRNFLDKYHRATLKDYKIAFEEVSGDWEERFEKMKKRINSAD